MRRNAEVCWLLLLADAHVGGEEADTACSRFVGACSSAAALGRPRLRVAALVSGCCALSATSVAIQNALHTTTN